MTDDRSSGNIGKAFQFFTEVGIIHQLATNMLAKALPGGVHPSHFAILSHLSRAGNGWSAIRIASAMQITKTTMTHSMKVLMDHGFIETQPNPDDARGKLVFISPKGRAFQMEAQQAVGQMFGGLFEQEHLVLMAKLAPDLAELRRHLDENRPKD